MSGEERAALPLGLVIAAPMAAAERRMNDRIHAMMRRLELKIADIDDEIEELSEEREELECQLEKVRRRAGPQEEGVDEAAYERVMERLGASGAVREGFQKWAADGCLQVDADERVHPDFFLWRSSVEVRLELEREGVEL